MNIEDIIKNIKIKKIYGIVPNDIKGVREKYGNFKRSFGVII